MGAAPKPKPNVVPMRTLNDKEALAWLDQRGRIETSVAALARDWRWNSKKVKSSLDRWSAAGHIDVKPGLGGKTVISVIATEPGQTGDMAPAESSPVGMPALNVVPTVMSAATPIAAMPAGLCSEPAADTAKAAPAEPAARLDRALEQAAAVVGAPVRAETSPVAAARSGAPAPVSALGPSAAEPASLLSRLAALQDPAVARISAPAAATMAVPAAATMAVPAAASMPAPAAATTPAPAAATMPAPAVVAPIPAPATAVVLQPRGSGFVNALAYLIAVALAGIAAFFSISGMIVLFPGAPTAIVIMGVVMESAKLVTVAFLAHQWRTLAWLSRLVLVILVAGLAAINAAGVYSQLVAAHFGDRVSAESDTATRAATLAAETDMQTQTVADFDRRVAQIDGAIAEMTKRGRASGALEAIATQRKQRDALVAQRRQEAEKLVTLKSEAAAVTAENHKIEVEAAPIMYVAQIMGASTEQAIRLLILLMVLTCDPLALALTAAASRPRWKR